MSSQTANSRTIGSSDSVLTEFDTILRFAILALDSPNYTIEKVDVPTGNRNRPTETKETFIEEVAQNSHISKTDASNLITDKRGSPDIIGEYRGRPWHCEAKGGNKVPNNASHELSYVMCKNLILDENVMESSLMVPRDRARKFRTRLTNKYEGMKNKAGLEGYMEAFEMVKNQHNNNIKFSVFLVWNEVERVGLVPFLRNEYRNLPEGREGLDDLEPIHEI